MPPWRVLPYSTAFGGFRRKHEKEGTVAAEPEGLSSVKLKHLEVAGAEIYRRLWAMISSTYPRPPLSTPWEQEENEQAHPLHLRTTPYTIHHTNYTLHTTHFTLHTTSYTHPPYTLHHTHFTQHPTHYTQAVHRFLLAKRVVHPPSHERVLDQVCGETSY